MENKSISVIIPVHDQAEDLERNLPAFLTLPYEGKYEVIVVDDMSSDETPDVLKRMKKDYPLLYTTFLPESVIVNPSRMRLALSIGVKASHCEYIVIADIRNTPTSVEWLSGLADGEVSLVFTNRKRDQVTHVTATELKDLRAVIRKGERRSFRGYYGKYMKRRRGLYEALCVRREHAWDAVRLCDQKIRGLELLGLRLRVWAGLW